MKSAIETSLGEGVVLTSKQAAALKRKTVTLVIPESLHQASSRTYGGRNNVDQIAADASNLRAAASKDMEALRPGLLDEGYTDEQIDAMINELHQQNELILKEFGIEY